MLEMLNKIFNEDCFTTLSRLKNNTIDLIITSPPFNSSGNRKGGPADIGKYDVYKDNLHENDYISWTIDVFREYSRVLKENRVILYNFSYSIENPSLPYKLASEILINTDLDIVDTIIWKKKSSMPHPASYNRLNRRWEYFWVFARKSESKTFKMFKEVTKVSEKTGQKYYAVLENIIEAKNNDGPCELNRATYSSEIIEKLISMYGTKGDIILDNFAGTGTSFIAAINKECHYIGCEISKEQCDYANNRIKKHKQSKSVKK